MTTRPPPQQASNETRFTLTNGRVAYFNIPWDIDEKDLSLCEEMFSFQIESIRKYRSRVSARHEWWLQNRHLAP